MGRYEQKGTRTSSILSDAICYEHLHFFIFILEKDVCAGSNASHFDFLCGSLVQQLFFVLVVGHNGNNFFKAFLYRD